MRRAAKVDHNQSEIVSAMRKVGASVLPLHAVGGGCPDLLAGYRGKTLLIEVKDGQKPPSQRKLTPDQQVFHQTWRGSVHVVESVQDALDVLDQETRGFRHVSDVIQDVVKGQGK